MSQTDDKSAVPRSSPHIAAASPRDPGHGGRSPGTARVAFAAIVDRNEARLLMAARGICCGDDDWAQDLVQDALVRGYEAYLRGAFADGTNERAWLLRILTNGFINDRKRRARWTADLSPEAFEMKLKAEGPAVTGGRIEEPESALLSRELDEPLSNALAKLPEEFRLAVLLVDVHGLEYAEAAKALDVPVGTVRSRLSRGRLQLHALLQSYGRDLRRI